MALIFQNFLPPQTSPDRPGKLFQAIPWTFSFLLKYKSFLGKGEGGKKNCVPLFPSPNASSKILTSTGWKSRLIRQESLVQSQEAVFRCLSALPPSESLGKKRGGSPQGGLAAHNSAIICLKFLPLRNSLHVIKLGVPFKGMTVS